MKRAVILTAVLMGCSMHAPEHQLPPVSAQPSWNPSAAEYNAPLCNNNPRARIDRIFYTIDCDSYRFSHIETDSGCSERLLYEADERKRFVDYGCNGTIDIYWRSVLRQGADYSYYQPADENSPATEEQEDEYNQALEGIGQKEIDAVWRFRRGRL